MDFLGRATTFVRVVEAGSFSSASRSLRLSLAAVSRQITSLEEELGAPLVVRTTRRLQVTEEGQRFYEHACRLVREAEAARACVRAERAVAGQVVISASVSLGIVRLIPALPMLLETHPGLDIALRLEDRSADLISEGVDIAIRAALVLPDTVQLVAQSIATFQPVVVASPAYLERAGTPRDIGSLSTHAALVGPDSPTQWRFIAGNTERTISITPKLRIGTLLGQRAAALAGLGIATLPDFIVEEEVRRGALKKIDLGAELAPIPVYAVVRADARKLPRIRAVVEHLAQTLPLDEGSSSSSRHSSSASSTNAPKLKVQTRYPQ